MKQPAPLPSCAAVCRAFKKRPTSWAKPGFAATRRFLPLNPAIDRPGMGMARSRPAPLPMARYSHCQSLCEIWQPYMLTLYLKDITLRTWQTHQLIRIQAKYVVVPPGRYHSFYRFLLPLRKLSGDLILNYSDADGEPRWMAEAIICRYRICRTTCRAYLRHGCGR